MCISIKYSGVGRICRQHLKRKFTYTSSYCSEATSVRDFARDALLRRPDHVLGWPP